MPHRRIKIALLCTAAAVLAVISAAVIYADGILYGIYREQQKNISSTSQATPVPVLQATPVPTRRPLDGDIASIVNFPEEDTGANADYSYQSDELRIAVTKVQELGVTYFVADIWMRNISCYRTAFSGGKFRGKRESAETISRSNNAILAVNGDFLGGLVIRNGELYRKATLRATPTPALDEFGNYIISSAPPRPERAVCVLYSDGRMATAEYEDFRSSTAMRNGAWQGWQFGPTLVRNGKATGDVNAQGRSPRCMLGYYEPGHYCIVLIDGRQKGYSVGMNFEEMQELALSLGLAEAYNLDGGGSAIMTFNGSIINSPSGKGEARNLPDMVVIGEYLTPGLLFQPTPSPTPNATPALTPPNETEGNVQ